MIEIARRSGDVGRHWPPAPPLAVTSGNLLHGPCDDETQYHEQSMVGQAVRNTRRWGGKRAGAGRKRRSPLPSPPHVTRPLHVADHPLHVTLRVVADLPSLRKKRVFRAVKQAFLLANTKSKLREDFRLTHFSVQGNHIHLVTEATDETRLARGVQGLAVRIARRVNGVLSRRGRVFAQRYHARALRTPLDVRRVIAYVLLNEQRHLYQARRLTLLPWYFDACSSASEFDGWRHLSGLPPPPAAQRDVTVAPRSELLRSLWRRHGLIAPNEIPGSSTPR